MWFLALPVLIIGISITAIAVVVFRHFSQIKAIEIESLPAEQEAAMKAALMEKRLKRKILDFKNKMLPIFRKFGKFFSDFGKDIHSKISSLEKKYRQKPTDLSAEQQEDIKQKIKGLLNNATHHRNEEQYHEAENNYIEVLTWDPKNLDAYLGLGEVYILKKEFEQAKETLSYLMKLISQQEDHQSISIFSSPLNTNQITEAYYDYSISLQSLGETLKAKEQIDEVIKRDPKNPKYLDKAIELSIDLEDRVSAQEAFNTLKEVNPENQKLESLEEKIRAIRG